MTSEEYKELSLNEFDQVAEDLFSDLLDAGCGTGAMLGMFQRDYSDKNYTGVNLSENQLKWNDDYCRNCG